MSVKLIILSVGTFLLGCGGVAFSLWVIIAEENYYQASFTEHAKMHQLKHVFEFHLDKNIIDLTTGLILILSIMEMGFSLFLFVGVKKSKPGFVLAYFFYGIVLLLLLIVSALLEFLQGLWDIGLITLIISGIYSNCLTEVYRFYDNTKTGIIEFGTTGHSLLINEEQVDNLE